MPYGYSDTEWSYLVQPYDVGFPDDWSDLRDDRAAWEPRLREVCERHGLTYDDRFERARGSHAVFLFPELVVKFYARYSPVWFPREVEAQRVLADAPGIRVAQIFGADDRDEGRGGHPYIAMERLAGEPWMTLRNEGTLEQKISAVRQMARAARAIHAVDPARLASYHADPDEWMAMMRERAAIAPEYLAEELSEALAPQVAPYLDEHLDRITSDFTPTLLSTDINSLNALFVVDGNDVVMSGMIDFGDMEVGPLEYEWPSVVQKALRYDRDLVAAFFDEYGLSLPFDEEAIERLKLYSLLHRFPTVPWFAKEHPEIGSLPELLSLQWQAGK